MSITLPISRGDAERLADQLEGKPAEEVLAAAIERFSPRIVLTCSWQKQSSVLVHMLSEIAPETRVGTLDTGVLFTETYETRDRLMDRYPLNY